jgi:hypothetical protein
MSGEAEGEGFLSRWSRRKRSAAEPAEGAEAPPAEALPTEALAIEAVPVEVPAAEPEGRAVALGASPASPACQIPNLPAIDLESLPGIEELTAESDFSLFLRPGVPALLRNAALRRMWSLDPAIRDYIGPVDYQWDFNTPGGLPFGFSNTLDGDVAKLLAQAIGKIEELAGEEAPEATPPEAPAELPEAEPPALLVAEEAVPPPARLPPAEEPAPPPRRRHGGALPG